MKTFRILLLFLPLLFPLRAHSGDFTQLANSQNRFGFKLLGQLWKNNQGKPPANLFISPASITWAFGMVLNGAGGATLSEIQNVLEISGVTPDQLNSLNLALRQNLEKADPKVTLAVANSLWGKPGTQFVPAFLEKAKQFYSAQLGILEKADTINTWVSQKTNGKITSIITQAEITPDTILVLLNALYFKGAWGTPFKKELTAPKPFHLSNGQNKDVPMMKRSDKFMYVEDPQWQAIQLPYGMGRFQMTLLLPAASSNLNSLLSGLNVEMWQRIHAKMTSRQGRLELPRFKIDYLVELAETLQAMGMKLPFSTQADFKNLAQMPPGIWVKISSVRHKTYLDVNEEGTEAAAVTQISMLAGSAPPPPGQPFEMVIDRPFVTVIHDRETGLILFMGAIVEPN